MYQFGHSVHHPVFGILFLIVVAALVAVGVVLLVRTWRNPPGRPMPSHFGATAGPPADPALNELRMRYARGDITWDEYSQRARHLGYPVPPDAGSTGAPPMGHVPSSGA